MLPLRLLQAAADSTAAALQVSSNAKVQVGQEHTAGDTLWGMLPLRLLRAAADSTAALS
jgi:hypothetical protein